MQLLQSRLLLKPRNAFLMIYTKIADSSPQTTFKKIGF